MLAIGAIDVADISNPIFHDETAAREWLEARVWAKGRNCPHCGVVDQSTLMKGKSHRPGLYQCNACREPFTVTVGTLYELSLIHISEPTRLGMISYAVFC